jgi:hypothetical protein
MHSSCHLTLQDIFISPHIACKNAANVIHWKKSTSSQGINIPQTFAIPCICNAGLIQVAAFLVLLAVMVFFDLSSAPFFHFC